MLVNKGFLITRPRHDYLTNLIFYWCKDIIDAAKQKGFRILDLEGEAANRVTFNSYMRKNKPELVFFNGHGNAVEITGHNNETLVGIGNGDDLLYGSVVYARSCDAAQALAPIMVEKGTKAFLGYKRKFSVASSDNRISRPLEDKLAKLFIEPANIAPLALIKGNTVAEADKRSKIGMMKNVLYMLSSVATEEERSVASLLYGNSKAQVIVGDPSATV